MKEMMVKLFQRKYRSAWAVFAISMVLVLLASHGLYLQSKSSAAQQYHLHVADLYDSINERMRRHEQILLGGAGLFDATDKVSRMGWRTYVERLQLGRNYPGIQGVGYSQVITPAELASHIQAIRAEGFPTYSVRPPGQREIYTAIIYLEPFSDRNLAAFGYDMFSEATRAAAMRQAGRSGATAISGKVKLVQETHGKPQAGFLMYVPVYRKNASLASEQDRWAALRGFVYSPYRVNDLMRGLLAEERVPLNFRIYDGAQETEDALMYDASDTEALGQERGAAPQFSSVRTIDAYGRTWTVRFESRAVIEANWLFGQNVVLLVLGSASSLLLFAFVLSLSSRREHAEELAARMTAQTREKAETLRRSQQLLDSIVENIPVMVFVKRAVDLRFEVLNRAGEKLLGYARQDLIGKCDADFFPKEQADGFAAADRKVLQQPGVHEIPEETIRAATGQERTLRTMKIGLRNEAGEPTHLLGISLDITEQKAAQLAVQESAQHTQAILDNAVDGIITIDENGLVQSFNRAAERIFAYEAQQVIGRNISMLMPEPYQSEHDGYLSNYRRTSVPKIIGIGREVIGMRQDGSTFPMDLAVSRAARQGKPLFIGLVRDITERKRVEQLKTEFVSTVSHELRTPLTSISGALGLVCGGALGAVSDQAKTMLDMAYKNSQRLTHLINDLLDMEKLAAGKMRLDMQSHEIMPLVERAIDSTRAYAQQYQVQLVVTQRLDGVCVRVDAGRLEQVLCNFLSNAAKFSPPGGTVEIAARLHSGTVQVSVTDHGPGIPAEFRHRMFQKFSQADSSDTRQKGGTGLGLAISKELIERMNGLVGFESQEGQGSRFHFELPVLQQLSYAHTATPEMAGAPRVLVVEDDPDTATLMALMLHRAGYGADIAGTCSAAVQRLEQHRYAAITLDLLLPDQSGAALIRKLRSRAEFENLPIIVVSAYVDDGKLSIKSEFAAIDWLDKPIDEARLIAAVRHSLPRHALNKLRILHVEDDTDLSHRIATLGQEVANFEMATTLAQARQKLTQHHYDLVILDPDLPDGNGFELLPDIKARQPAPQVIVLSGRELNLHQRGEVDEAFVKSKSSNESLLAAIRQAIESKYPQAGKKE
jgi:PAS domain S-box-containing protein